MTAQPPPRTAVATCLAAILSALLPIIGCSGESAPMNSADSSGPRLVSLSPALTQMLHDLDRADALVGIGEYDPVAPEGVRVVGDLLNVDYEALLAVKPTAVLVQPGQAGVPDRLRRLGERFGFAIHSFDIETLDDALDALTSGVGEAIEQPHRAAALAERTREQMAALTQLTADRERRRVVLLAGLTPYATAAAPGTFLDEAIKAAGARNAIEETDILYPELDHEQLLSLDADAFVHLTSHDSSDAVNLPEDVAERFAVIEHPAALLPSTSLPTVTAKLIGLIHPELQEQAVAIVEAEAGGQADSEPSAAERER